MSLFTAAHVLLSAPPRSIVPVPPNVAPTINVELEVENGEVENYEVGHAAVSRHSNRSS